MQDRDIVRRGDSRKQTAFLVADWLMTSSAIFTDPEGAANASGAGNFNDIRDQALVDLGAIKQQFEDAGCSG